MTSNNQVPLARCVWVSSQCPTKLVSIIFLTCLVTMFGGHFHVTGATCVREKYSDLSALFAQGLCLIEKYVIQLIE